MLNYVERVRSVRNDAGASRFLGVRLTIEEEERLEKFRSARQLRNRSDAVRALVHEGSAESSGRVELPPTVRNEIEELVDDGYAADFAEAVAIVVHLGLDELTRSRGDRWSALREHARTTRDRRAARRDADREGRGLLRR